MSTMGHLPRIPVVAAGVLVAVLFSGTDVHVRGQDKGAPPWGEFLRRFNKDRLLKPPFHNDPEEGVKGLASKIRARELDIPNRKKAIRYLADLDCTVFPEAKAMLLTMLDPEVEKWEEVRFEAARGLRDMLSRHSCAPQGADARGGKNKKKSDENAWQQCSSAAKKYTRKARGQKEPEVPCHCRSCCDADTLNKLARTAYEMKENGCCYEPSQRVREMAVEAIKACGVPCHHKPYYANGEEPGPPPVDVPESGEGRESNGGELVPPPAGESVPGPEAEDTSAGVRVPARPGVTQATPISRLSKLCIVSLKRGERLATREEFHATHRGRIYYFSSQSARQEFLADPEDYAVAFGGCDPVHFVETQEAVEGRFLMQHAGRFFMFLTEENLEQFRQDPVRYLPPAMSPSAGGHLAAAE